MEAEKPESEEATVSSTEDNALNDETGSKTASETNGDGANSETTQSSVGDVGGTDANDEEKQNVEEKIEESSVEKTEAVEQPVSETKDEEKSESEGNKDTQVQESPPKAPEKDDTFPNEADITMPPIQTLGKGKRARIPNKRYSDIVLSPIRSSHKSNENGEHDAEDDEMSNISDVPSRKPRSDTSSPTPKKSRVTVDMSDPKYRKPFLHGWKRELVYRATFDNPNKRNGDIYYYSPTGKKIRSMRELTEVLKGSKELTVDNFTFYKEPLGLDDPEKEIIRDAKAWNKKTPAKGGSKTPNVLSPKAGTSKVSSPKTPESEAPQPTRRSGRTLGNIKIKLAPNKTRSDRSAKAEEEPMEVEPPPSKRSSTKKTTTKAIPNVEMEGKPCQPCSIRCGGVMGMVPTLQCRICLCLYHYECVGLSSHIQIQAYVCKNCQLEHGQSVATSASIVLPPLTPINTLKSMSAQSSVLPTLQRIPRPGDSPQQDTAISGGVPNMPRLLPLPKAKDVPTKQSKNPTQTATETKSLVGSVTSWLPHSSTIQVDNMRNKENEPIEAPRPQYVEYLAGRKFLIIPKHNVVSVSPTVIKPMNFESVSSEVEEAKNAQISTDEAPVQSTDEVPQTEKNEEPQENNEDKQEPVESSRSTRRSSKLNNTSNEKQEEKRLMDSYLQDVAYGYNTLLHVFQYLKVQDLLRAGCVCTMWRDIASHPSLWRTVRMKNSQVHSFEGLANTLEKHGTVHLDLRKMLLPMDSGDEIWPEFSKAIQKVQTLRKIDLSRCPASVVEQLAITNKDLEVINGVTIVCQSMSLDTLSSLKNLKELRLKSPCGLTLSSDITSLKELTSLTHLSLTSIKDLNKMSLSVIAALKNLESLDLGECNDFPDTFGAEILMKLTKLEKLRLEKGQGDCHTTEILEAVRQMPDLEQLELVNFDIKSGFDVALGACSNIKKLLLIPTYISQSATTNHVVLAGMLRLKSTLSHLVWGVTLELLRVTELFVDQYEDSDKKKKKSKKAVGKGDCIPVLKPVPLLMEKDEDIPPAHDPPKVEIIPLPDLQKLLLKSLPTTRVKILKIPFHATWRQSITDTVN
ncbi:uncharacterized protein LOC664527 isoform X2 [Tribolium castaneum]|uniref:MBD domain-containing protein n=1 Tax=Tribolium castaneum TaxID=7070 RepID=D2A0E1_TRICA|nr:PREDICTED: uncharacterized protein LOC664527 isoform X2 [Tribolium castaneum]EFA01707.1 hypothetical protein TcasGA2_TC007283 [Tribolium castaneum]|eukprot:XP_008192298.1 PREDICTED: uncharacterized protein LOC664527 isoform X2 [Tribolium castaneum]